MLAGYTRVDTAIKLTNLSRSTLGRLAKKKILRSVVIGGRQFFYIDDIERFIEERKKTAILQPNCG